MDAQTEAAFQRFRFWLLTQPGVSFNSETQMWTFPDDKTFDDFFSLWMGTEQ